VRLVLVLRVATAFNRVRFNVCMMKSLERGRPGTIEPTWVIVWDALRAAGYADRGTHYNCQPLEHTPTCMHSGRFEVGLWIASVGLAHNAGAIAATHNLLKAIFGNSSGRPPEPELRQMERRLQGPD
jgi:hypothetical protein